MAAFKLHDPPHRGPTFLLEFFDTRDFSKSRFLARDSVWGRLKMKEFWKNLEPTWSVFFLKPKKSLFSMGKCSKWPKVAKTGHAKNNQKRPKMP